MRELYSIVMAVLQPLLRLKLWQRGRKEPGYRVYPAERWGNYPHLVADDAASSHVWNESSMAYRPTVWIHAVSLGETRAAAVLLAALRPLLPGMRLLLTHGTATGRAEGAGLLQVGDRQVWLPWDTPVAVDQFLRRFQPVLGVLIETEVWPNLVAACHTRGMPLLLVNARLSKKSLAKARRLRWLARPAYQALSAVYAQTHADAQRLGQLGAPVHDVLGNLKFDAQPSFALLAQGQQWRSAWMQQHVRQTVVLFAISREGEEALFLAHLKTLSLAQRQAVQWLIVPRHPQRFDAVAALAQAQGFSVTRRSQWGAHGPASAAPADIWLGDSLGEMPLYYALADLALLGGSFLPLGGQNLIEAAACGCPVIMGPHTFNFAEAAGASVAAGAAFEVRDLPEGVNTACDLLHKPDLLQACRQAARTFVAAHRGAAARTAAVIAQRV
ncbi:MAG: hypothetical protein RLZZ401_554 [Pseudomonadota bacterium]|jgi:3-deoxy-D-manno-octulosonic-acid transferase